MTEYPGPNLHDPRETRVRFCPSPTGTPHVGMVRTALFNWAVRTIPAVSSFSVLRIPMRHAIRKNRSTKCSTACTGWVLTGMKAWA